MLISTGKTSEGDYGEESLTARFLMGLVFNEYAEVNREGKAFCEFGRRCLDLNFTVDDMNRATATIEFQADRVAKGADKTTFDALFTLETDWVWGFEVKYFDSLKEEQIKREVTAIEHVRQDLEYKNSGVLFLVPEQLLGTIVNRETRLKNQLAELIRAGKPRVCIASWDIVFEILVANSSPILADQIREYCQLRNQNKNYPPKLTAQPFVKDCKEWSRYFEHDDPISKNIPMLAHDSLGSFRHFTQGTAKVSDLFFNKDLLLAKEIINKWPGPTKTQQSYSNLQFRSRTKAQLHPRSPGVDIAIAEGSFQNWDFKELTSISIQQLNGYSGLNISWLNGDSKQKRIWPSRPASAFHVPINLLGNHNNPGWKELEALIAFAVQR